MNGSQPAEDAAARQLEQLLTHYIGPLASIVLARARKTASDDEALVHSLAKNIDAAEDRAAFLAAAARIVSASPTIDPARAAASTAAEPVTQTRIPSSAAFAAHVPVSRSGVTATAADGGAMKAGAIFLSYARENLAVAQSVADALRAAGLEVWLDLGELQPGDAWDLKIRRNIESCSFFVPLVSRGTEARQEGYFRREWNIAADRALNFADDVPFIVPVTIDETAAYTARVPERFRRAHWISLPRGEVTSELVDCLKQLVGNLGASR